jgi:phosphoglycolate phosphatase-like HAD superfamily hydrolase
MTLVLCWDIDGTLLTTARAGIFAWEDATHELVNQAVDFSSLDTAGLTDVEIAARILDRFGRAQTPSAVGALVRRYEALLPDRLHWRTGRVAPGVQAILEYLRGEPGAVSILLTGNTEAGAWAKLRHYGLDGYFERGAFADGARDRRAVARRALAVAREVMGREPETRSTYVIGDTPHDIACARAIGARAVAVASGSYGVEDLARHEPWWLLPALPEPEVFVDRLMASAT